MQSSSDSSVLDSYDARVPCCVVVSALQLAFIRVKHYLVFTSLHSFVFAQDGICQS